MTGIAVETASGISSISADFYIAALPVEVMTTLVTDDLKRAAPSLANLEKLKTRWMNGIQFLSFRRCTSGSTVTRSILTHRGR